MTLQIYAILFYCKRGYFCKLKTDLHVEKIDVIKLSISSKTYWQSSNSFLFAMWSCCTNDNDKIGQKTQVIENHNYFFFSKIYWSRDKDFLRFNILLLYGHNGPALGSEPLTQGSRI